MVLILLAMFFWEHGSIGAPSCQALFASYGGMLACAGHIIGRNPLLPPCVRVGACVRVRVRMRSGARVRVRACACVCACVCACGGCRGLAGAVRHTHALHLDPLLTHNSLLFTPHPTQLYPHTPTLMERSIATTRSSAI